MPTENSVNEINTKDGDVGLPDKRSNETNGPSALFRSASIVLVEAILQLKIKTAQLFMGYWLHRKRIAIVAASFISVVIVGISIYTFIPQSIHYVFADSTNCIHNPSFFPDLFKSGPKETFSLTRVADFSIGKMPIFSDKLCAIPGSVPLSRTTYTNHQQLSIGGLHLGKTIRVTTANYPAISDIRLDAKAIPINKSLVYKLSLPDATFNYAISGNEHTSPCTKLQTTLTCSVAPLKLAYAASYTTSVVRTFHGQTAGTALTQAVQTITAAAIMQTSINPGAVVYDKPQQITLQTNKVLASMQTVSLTTTNSNNATLAIPITSSFSGQTITINIANPLPRQATFDLHINNLTADDQSTLQQPYDLSFTTSGGPEVANINLPAYGVSSGQSIVLTFNQTLLASQTASSLASLTVNGAVQPASYSLNGDQLIINPIGNYPVCATIQVQLNNEAQNIYGVSGNSAWSYQTRSHCYTTFSIGSSVDGRPITAYKFGGGSSMVLYIGAMEGNEQNSSELLSQWIPNIDANPSKIPSYRTLVVIPTINTDGFAADTRLNADGIDLNRNFPANNWQTQVTEPTAPTVWTNDGGPNPLSEPESQALATFYLANTPRLTMTMHSHGGIVEANDADDSDALGAQYASIARYEAIPT